MKDLAGLGHLFVVTFLFHFASFMVIPAVTDVTMEAVCPGRDECSVAIYLSGFQNAVSIRRHVLLQFERLMPGSMTPAPYVLDGQCRSPGWGRSWSPPSSATCRTGTAGRRS
jgi:hypothetical protein